MTRQACLRVRAFQTVSLDLASASLLLLAAGSVFAQPAPCTPGTHIFVAPGDHPATVLSASGASCRVHYEDNAYADGWTYNFNILAKPRGDKSLCVAGSRVLVDPGGHPATVLSVSGASCRVHYEDNAFRDGWIYNFNIRPPGAAGGRPPAPAMPQLGRYDITVGTGSDDGYLLLSTPTSYEIFLPGGKSGGAGTYAFDATSGTIRWSSGPLTNSTWDGTQQFETSGGFQKIRIGQRSVATFKGPQ
jgi:hypothetical protein